MKKYNIFLLFILFVFGSSCDEKILQPYEVNSEPPGVVTNVEVENLPGAAKITYTTPDDTDLLYVEANYLRKGVEVSTKATLYNNELEVVGFPNVDPVEVSLVAVDRSENRSEVVRVTVEPEEPPYQTIASSIQIAADFGGAKFMWENKNRDNVSVSLYITDSLGVRQPSGITATSLEKGLLTVRGFEVEERNFALKVGDRWDNYSELVEADLTPLYEDEADKTQFFCLDLDNDASWSAWAGVTENLWDDITTASSNCGHTLGGNDWPPALSIDLGATYKLSRWKWWQRPGWPYAHGNPESWEFYVYKGEGEPSQSGDWDEWELVKISTAIKPSGPGSNTQEDLDAMADGHESVFDDPETFDIETTSPTRYVRMKCIKTWDGATYVDFSEVAFYGIKVE